MRQQYGVANIEKELLAEGMGAGMGGGSPKKEFVFSSPDKAKAFAAQLQKRTRLVGKPSVKKTKGWATYSVHAKFNSFADTMDTGYKPEKKHYLDIIKDLKEERLVESKGFKKGQRVNTPSGPGSVAYQRMAGPDYAKPQAVSVVLDKKKGKAGYTGSMFAADKVKPLKESAGSALDRLRAKINEG